MKQYFFICLVMLSSSLCSMEQSNPKTYRLLFIDTTLENSYCFNRFFALAQQEQFAFEYKPWHAVKLTDVETYDGVCMNLPVALISPMAGPADSYALQYMQQLVDQLKLLTHKIVIFLLPSIPRAKLADLVPQCSAFCTPWAPGIPKNIYEDFLEYLLPKANKSAFYETPLLLKTTDDIPKVDIASQQADAQTVLSCLPANHSYDQRPLALYVYNQDTQNHILFANQDMLTFADIAENFWYNPIDSNVRLNMLGHIQQLFFELSHVAQHRTLPEQKTDKKLPPLLKPEFLEAVEQEARNQRAKQSRYQWIEQEQIWCGWAELENYFKKPLSLNQIKSEDITAVLKSGLNVLWFEINPEWYLSRYGLRRQQTEQLWTHLKVFMHELHAQSTHLHLPAPRIFIGTDITSNYKSKTARNPVIDIYGRLLPNIPSPLDDAFWQEELFDVFEAFLNQWPQISHHIPISGIFLDFEMYHAQTQTGQYTSLMDFSDLAWRKYCLATDKIKLHKLPIQERIRHLHTTQKFDEYHTFLHNQAVSLGKKIKRYFDLKAPQAQCAAYNMLLPYNWFYTGIMAGLSSAQHPLLLATFAQEFFPHTQWLKAQNIHLYHTSALMLSKFRTQKDFDLIDAMAQHHDGVWFNKISRLALSRDKSDWDWDYGVEVTQLPTDVVVDQMKEHIQGIQRSFIPKNIPQRKNENFNLE